MKGEFKILQYGALFWLMAAQAKAVLPGAEYAFPRITFSSANSSSVHYDPADQLFSMTTSPAAIQFAGTEAPLLISGTKSIEITAHIDGAGALIPGSFDDGFAFSGSFVRVSGGHTDTYSGELLTGRILDFAFQETGDTDQYEFLFQPVGGALFGFFDPENSVALVTSEHSTFDGSFTTAFGGRAKGVVSSTVVPEPSARSLFLCGMAVVSLMIRRARCTRKFVLN